MPAQFNPIYLHLYLINKNVKSEKDKEMQNYIRREKCVVAKGAEAIGLATKVELLRLR